MCTQRKTHKVATTMANTVNSKTRQNGVHWMDTLGSVEVNLNTGFVLCSELSAPEKQNKQYRPVALGIFFKAVLFFLT